ncbi:MAG: hypothetical protein ACREX8_00975, partial [Gammaproteobacteria bacterium]
ELGQSELQGVDLGADVQEWLEESGAAGTDDVTWVLVTPDGQNPGQLPGDVDQRDVVIHAGQRVAQMAPGLPGPGRPEVGPRVAVRFAESDLAAIDCYAATHNTSRSEAIRRLVAAGLRSE